MHDADLYEQNNGVQKRDALAYLEKYSTKMKWKLNDNRIIDIGCGDGSVTNMLKKYFPTNYKLLGVDISENMVKYAQDHHSNENTSFTVLDIAGDLPISLKGKFDRAFSFYTLHWVQKQEQAFKNIFDLLERDGECLMVFLASNPIYDAYRALSRRDNWKVLLQDVEKIIGPYHDSKEPAKEVIQLMETIGFIDINVECEELTFLFDNMDDIKNHLRSINPFKIPKNKYDDFLEDCIRILQDIELNQSNKLSERIRICYTLLVVFGHKPNIDMEVIDDKTNNKQ